MSTSINLADVISTGIEAHFANVRIERKNGRVSNNISSRDLPFTLNNKLSVYILQRSDQFIANYACEIYIKDVIKICIIPPITKIIPGSKHKEFINSLQIQQWFLSHKINTSQALSAVIVTLELNNPSSIETIIDWIEYCGGITDGIKV